MSFFSFQDIIACTTGIIVLITLLLALDLVAQPPPQPLPSETDLTKAITDAQATLNSLRDLVRQNNERLEVAPTARNITQETVDALRTKVAALRDKTRAVKWEHGRLQVELNQLRIQQQALADENKRFAEAARLEESKTRIEFRNKPGSGKEPLLIECSANETAVFRVLPSREVLELARFKSDPVQDTLKWARKRDPNREYFVLLVRQDALTVYEQLRGALEDMHFTLGWDLWPAEKRSLGS